MKNLSEMLVDEIDDYTGFHKASDDISYIIVRNSEVDTTQKTEESNKKATTLTVKNISVDASDTESK